MPAELFQHRGVVVRVDEHGDIGVVLGGRADHGRPADIDILDARGKIRAARDRVLERIEVDDHHIDRTYPVRLQGFSVRGIAANREQSAVHRRMQGLDAAVHHLGKAGQLGNVDDREPRLAQRLARAAGGDEFDAVARESAGELDDPALVGNGDESARGAAQIFGHGGPLHLLSHLVIPDRREAASAQSEIPQQQPLGFRVLRAGTASRAAQFTT